jgi:prefoldin subunit 5
LRQESQVQRSQIQLFSAKIEELDKKLSKLKDFDRRIRIIANLEKGQESFPFISMGGFSPSMAHGKSKEESKGSE